MASQLIVSPRKRGLWGSVPLPDDEEIALARIALAVLSRGRTTLTLKCEQAKIETFLRALAACGVHSEQHDSSVSIKGTGLFGLQASSHALDVRGEPSVGALLLALLVSRPFSSELWVDDVVGQLLVPSLSVSHEMSVSDTKDGEGGVVLHLNAAKKGERKAGLDVVTTGIFSWVKQALLLVGMRGRTVTVVEEKLASPDHLERAMLRARIPLDAVGTVATLHPPRDDDASAPQTYSHIGSSRSLGALGLAALAGGDCRLTARGIGINPTRCTFMTVARLMGAAVGMTPAGDREGEPFGDVSFVGSVGRAIAVDGETSIRLGDDIFYVMGLAALVSEESCFEDLVPEARGGDPRIVGRVTGLLRSAGARVSEEGGAVRVRGPSAQKLRPLTITTGGDARLALLATGLAMRGEGTSTIDDVDCLRQAFPRWVGTLRALGADVQVKVV